MNVMFAIRNTVQPACSDPSLVRLCDFLMASTPSLTLS